MNIELLDPLAEVCTRCIRLYRMTRMTQTADKVHQHNLRLNRLNERFVEIEPELPPYGPEFENLEFDNCRCVACGTMIGAFLTENEETGGDVCTWSPAFMDAAWNLWCEDCSWDAVEKPIDPPHGQGKSALDVLRGDFPRRSW